MKKRTIILIIAALMIIGIFILITKNREYFLTKYEWHKAEKRAEGRHKELMEKVEKKEKLESIEISEITGYFQLTSKYDEGIKVLEGMLKNGDHRYEIYFNLSGLYAMKARAAHSESEKKKLVSTSYNYMMEGFQKVPEKPLAFYIRGKAYGVLGCIDKAIEDFRRAIEESKGANVIMLGGGSYVDRNRFLKIVEQDIQYAKETKTDCLIEGGK